MDTQLEALHSVEMLISHLLSSSEEKKLEGESMFDLMKEKDPNSLALRLAQLVGASDSYDNDFREKCADLLYKLLTEDKCHIWNNILSASTQLTIKSILLARINLEDQSRYIIYKLCRTVSELCNILFLQSNNWPELLHFLQECVRSNSNMSKESFFIIIDYLAPDRCKELFPDIMSLQSLFLKTLNDDALNLYMRIPALGAAINFIQCISSLNELKQVQSLYPGMMRTLVDALNEGNSDSAVQYVLRRYIKLAKNEPRFFRIDIVDVVNTVLEIADAMNVKERTRQLALEFLLTLVEARGKAPGMMKKLPLFIHRYFALLLNLLVDAKDEPSWHTSENCVDWAWNTDSCKFGWHYLYRFSKALGGNTFPFIAIEQLDAYFVSLLWEKRHAALTALTYIAKGCPKVMIKYLERVLSIVLHSFQDPHPRVRWAAIYSIVQMSVVFSPNLQEQHHNQVVPALIVSMDDFQHPRVQAIAAAAIESYFNNSEKSETLLPYLNAIFNKLLVLLQYNNQMVQEIALDALTSVTWSSKEHFQKYYDLVIPHLKTIMINANERSDHMLQSKALGCITMVGMTVGREKFRDNINQVMEVLRSLQESQAKEFDTVYHNLKAWVRMGYCMERDFSPHMSTIMPLLVKCAVMTLSDKCVQPANLIDELNNTIHKVKFGDEIIYAKKSDFLKLKYSACGSFGSYAEILEEDFYPWISQVTTLLLPLLQFYMDSDVRKEASYAMRCLLKSAKLAVDKGTVQGGNSLYFKQLSCDIILALGDALRSEPETIICVEILRSLLDCLEICGLLLSGDMLPSIVDVIKHIIKESSCRREELAEREKSEDFGTEEAELLKEEIEQEEDLYRNVGFILRLLVEIFKATFLPFLDELSSYIMPTRGKDKTSQESIACILIFNGLVRQCGKAALRYYDRYLPFLLESSNNENPKVRQCALYGLCLCAECGVSVFKPFVREALPRISEVITHLHAREPENEDAFYNAVCALGQIFQFHREIINLPHIFPAWLNCLPLEGDTCVHYQLCLMVERLDMDLLGPNYENFPKVLSVFAQIICAGNDLATEGTIYRMIDVLRNL